LKISGFTYLIVVWFFVLSCNKSDRKDALVASVGDKQLTWKQLEDIIPNNSSAEDSILLAERYIEDWAKEQVLLVQAEANLSDEQKNFDHLIENYRKSLVTYAFEAELVKQKLDTLVGDEEIETYYAENRENFKLKDYIVQVKFCAVNKDFSQMKNLKKLFFSEETGDLVKWQQLCVEIGAAFYFEEDKWLRWDELTKQVPLNVYDVETFLKTKGQVEFEKNDNLYLLLITDYQLSGTVSPLSFEREKIKSLIINMRKMDLLSKMRVDLYNDALTKNEIKFYHKKQ
jgi:hypothetical protein